MKSMACDCNTPIKDKMLMQSLKEFFSDPMHATILRRTLDPKRSGHISLRLIDWICTTYSKQHRLLFARSNGTGVVDIHSSYKSHLRSFGKNRFDVFRRGEKFTLSLGEDDHIETTIAQLNFFRWLITHDVLVYLEENKDKIVELQKASQQPQEEKGPLKTKEKKKRGYHMSRIQARVVFD